MKRKNREISIFSMSTLDLFACATGAFIMLTLILLPYYLNVDPDKVRSVKEQLVASETTRAGIQSELDACNVSLTQLGADSASFLADREKFNAEQSELQNVITGLRQQSSSVSTREARLQERISNLEVENSRLRSQCSDVPRNDFLLVVMTWASTQDIDLHITDEQGRRYFYGNVVLRGSDAIFLEDSKRGPGNEIWFHPNPAVGNYKIQFNYFGNSSNTTQSENPVVKATVFFQGGSTEIPSTTLTKIVGAKHADGDDVASINVASDGTISVVVD